MNKIQVQQLAAAVTVQLNRDKSMDKEEREMARFAVLVGADVIMAIGDIAESLLDIASSMRISAGRVI